MVGLLDCFLELEASVHDLPCLMPRFPGGMALGTPLPPHTHTHTAPIKETVEAFVVCTSTVSTTSSQITIIQGQEGRVGTS